MLSLFLKALSNDVEAHPEKLTEISPELRSRIEELTKDVPVDLDEQIEGDVDL
jgi:hypothetical protein